MAPLLLASAPKELSLLATALNTWLAAVQSNQSIPKRFNGPGNPAGDQERVFERFVRTTDVGNGCGLGLAIVKNIMERRAGQVELADAHPGLCVRVRLPMAGKP